MIYQRAVSKLIPGVIQGQQISVFAYGQTGSGKSFTMLGSNLTGIAAGSAVSNDENAGLYYLATVELFKFLQTSQMTVTVSLFEIYGKKLFDLLGERAIVKCLEDGAGKMQFKGLTEHPIDSAANLLRLIELGAKHRSTGSTSRNADSSRSHAVLQIHLRQTIARAEGHRHGK
jgi:kinesin family protein 2/24